MEKCSGKSVQGGVAAARLRFLRPVGQQTDVPAGTPEQELARLRRYIAGCEDGGKQGFGLGNVNQRIHRYYGEEYGIFFESEENRGTEAVIIIPAKIIEQKS